MKSKLSTRKHEESQLRSRLIPTFGTKRLREIRTEMIQEAITKWAGEVSAKTVRNAVATMRSMWQTAKAWGLVDFDPLKGYDFLSG